MVSIIWNVDVSFWVKEQELVIPVIYICIVLKCDEFKQ